MRVLLVILVAVVLGVATGIAAGMLRVAIVPWDGDPAGRIDNPRMPGQVKEGQPLPKAVFKEVEHNFGSMDMEAEGSHEFIVTNEGEGPLWLTAGGTSCNCTLSEIDDDELGPGESTKITVTWTPNKVAGPYRQSATITTNDPNSARVELVIVGRVTLAVLAEPRELVFTRVTAGEPTTGEVRLLSYLSESLEIVDCKLDDPRTADYFEVTFSKIPSEELVNAEIESDLPDGAEEGSEGNPGKKAEPLSGCLIRVTVKPGLPQGPFQQKIVVATNLEAAPSFTIPVTGTVVGDISIFGRDFDTRKAVLNLGNVSSREGIRRDLTLLARGPHAGEVEFSIQQIIPDTLEIELGETAMVSGGTFAKTPLSVRIPPGAPLANHLGSDQGAPGEIVLRTSHPDIPTLRIFVVYAVTNE